MCGSRLTVVIISLALVLMIGLAGGYWWGQHRSETEARPMYELTTFHLIAAESKANMEAYFLENPEVAMYALQRNIKLLESFRENESLLVDKKVLAWDLTLSYARLGRLADKLRRKNEAVQAYSHALDATAGTGREFKSLQDLLSVVDALDTKYREATRGERKKDRE
jgi:hypothetical protein